jgi:hypothetical protein
VLLSVVLTASDNGASSAQVTAAIIGAIALAAVGIGNLIYSFFNGKWDRRDRAAESKADREQAITQAHADREQALTQAREEREHQLDLMRREGWHRLQVVREERMFDQRRDTYLETMQVLEHMQAWVADTYPVISYAGHDPRPPFDSGGDSDIGPRLVVMGSSSVWEATSEYRRMFREFAATASELDAYISQRAPEIEARLRLQEIREQLGRQQLAVAELMRAELRHPDTSADEN